MFLTFLISAIISVVSLLNTWVSLMPIKLNIYCSSIESVRYHGTAPKIASTSLWCNYEFSNWSPTDMAADVFIVMKSGKYM